MFSEFYEFYVKGNVRMYVSVCYQSVLQCIEFTSEEFIVIVYVLIVLSVTSLTTSIIQLLFISTCNILRFYVNRVMRTKVSQYKRIRECCVH